MANRFQSILDNIAEGTLADLRRLYPQMSHGMHWFVDGNGQLCASNANETFVFEFAQGDPDTEAFLIMLNNLPVLVQALGTKR